MNYSSKSRAQGTIEYSKSRAQGTIEYLVIIAVVVVISLALVTILLTQGETAQKIGTDSDKTQGIIGKGGISITDSMTSSSGDSVISLKNNSGETLTITKLTPIDDQGNLGATLDYNSDLLPGYELPFILTGINSICPCTIGKTTTCNIKITFFGASGLEKNETIKITNTCTETITDTNTTITPLECITNFDCEINEICEKNKCIPEEIEEEYFIFLIETNFPNQVFSFQIEDAVDINVNWGDGTYNIYNGTEYTSYEWATAYHEYTTPGDYNIKVKGTASRISFWQDNEYSEELTTPTLLKDIYTPISNGVNGITHAEYMFRDTEVTEFTAQDFFDQISSNVTTTEYMFYNSNFNQNINNWDVSNVTYMRAMFDNTPFNQNISSWDTENVVDMSRMFNNATNFNQDLSNWNVSSVTDHTDFDTGATSWILPKPIFNDSYFIFGITTDSPNQTFSFQIDDAIDVNVNWGDGSYDIYNWTEYIAPNYATTYASAYHEYVTPGDYNISVRGIASRISFYEDYEDMELHILTTPTLLKDIFTPVSNGVTGITSAQNMFRSTSVTSFTAQDFFDETSANVTDMSFMFFESQFNQDISGWDTSNVENMFDMFASSQFNQNVGSWDTQNVTNMSGMFSSSCPFNQDISGWNTQNVTSMAGMFAANHFFNQDISDWNINKVTTMNSMFWNSSFNQDISNWNTQNVTDMTTMFAVSSFNQNISDWNVSNVTSMLGMFYGAEFNQNISNWNTSKVTSMAQTFYNNTYFNQDLSSWNVSSVTDHTDFDTGATSWVLPKPNFE